MWATLNVDVPFACRFFYLKFFNAEEYHYGTGAQIQAAEGVFGKMIAEGRIVVFADYDRADHDGCKGKHLK